MKNLSSNINRIISGCLSISLFFGPTSFSFAQDGNENRKLNRIYSKEFKQIKDSTGSNVNLSKDIMNIVDTTGALLGQLQQQKIQQSQQIQQMQMNQSLQQALTPKPVPDDFFPNCQLLQAKSDRIDGLCETIESENSYLESLAVQQSAKMNANLIENHFIEGNKMGDSSGLQCFKENAKALRVQLKDRLVKIDALLADLQKANSIFEQNVQQDENKLKEIDGLLNGGDGFEFDSSNRDLSGFFQDKSCASVITLNAETTKGKGLIALRKDINKDNVVDKAREITTRRKSIERDFRNDLKLMVNDIDTKLQNGTKLEDLKITDYGDLDIIGTNSSLSKGFKNAYRDIINEKTSILTEIKQLGGDASEFSAALTDSTAPVKVTLREWERRKNNECFDEAVTSRIGNFQQRAREANPNISNGGTNIRDYFSLIKNILGQKSWTLEQKIREIKKEEQKYGYSSIKVQMGASLNGRTTNKNWKISDAITSYANDCVQQFNSIPNSIGLTKKDIVKKAKKIHSRFQRLNKTAPQKIANTLSARFLRCEGVSYSDSPADCNADKLNSDGANFCMDQSLKCASAMTSCYAKADKLVKNKQMEQKNIARVYNEKVRSFKKVQLALFDRVEQEFKFVSQGLKQYFPGASFDIAFDLNYNPQKDGFEKKHGVQLIATKDFMKNMIENVKKVKENIVAQNQKIVGDVDSVTGDFSGIVGEKLKTVQANYEKELEYWSKLSNKCDEIGKEFIAQRNKSIADQNQAIAEKNEKIQRFCSTVETISHTPGCGKVSDLTDTAFEIAEEVGMSSADAASLGTFASYQAVCESSQSHDYDESRSPASVMSAEDICAKSEYKKTKSCSNFSKFNKSCTAEYYTNVGFATTYKDKVAECKDNIETYKKLSEFKEHGIDTCDKLIAFINKNKKVAICGTEDDKVDKEIEVREPLETIAVKLSQQKEVSDIRKQVGEQSFEVCNAQEGSSRGIVKGFLDDLGDMNNMNANLAQDI